MRGVLGAARTSHACNAAIGLLLCTGAACREAPAPVDRVRHLDPRLADGRSAADVLAARRQVVGEWTWPGPTDLPAAWTVADADLRATESGAGVLVVGTTPDGTRAKRVTLRWRTPSGAQAFNVVELVLGRAKQGTTRVTWRTERDPAEAPASQIEVSHPELDEPTAIRIALQSHPEWRGDLRSLSITPNASGPQIFELLAVRLVDEGFAPGAAPLADDGDRGPDSGDGGLVACELDMRRAWPTDWDVPLFVRALDVPASARLELAFAFVRSGLPDAGDVRCVVEARDERGAWTELVARGLDADAARESRWHPLGADLGPLAGRVVDLRFRATVGVDGGIPDDAPPELERARVLLGEPLVVVVPEERSRARTPNVVLVTIDTTRADAVGGAAGRLARTPFLDSLEERALVATNHWSTSNSTTPAHASLLTGLHVQDHGVANNHSSLAPENVTLAESFRAAGWQTAAAVSVDHLRAPRSGLGQGFDRFWLSGPSAPRDGAATLAAVDDWLAEWSASGERPFFLWVHLFDPHTPYGPPDEFLATWPVPAPARVVEPATMGPTLYADPGGFLDGATNEAFARWLYGASVSYADALVGRLARALDERGWTERTALVVTSDHGESLGEHDIWYQHSGLYAEVLRVPLYVALPGVPPARLEGLTSALDVPVTLWSWAGLERPDEARGRDLRELVRTPDPDRTVHFEHSHGVQVGSRDGRHHFIWTLEDYRQLGPRHFRPAGDRELYDHRVDPRLEVTLDEGVEQVADEVARWRDGALRRSAIEGALTPEQRGALEALGYLGE